MLLWLLPLLFVLHDLEEALFLVPWLRRNRPLLEVRFPRLSMKLYAHFDRISRPVFAAMAAEELVILLAVTFYAQWSGNYYPWLALLLAFGLHLLIHLAQAVAVRGYLPSLVTSLAIFPVVGWMLSEISNSQLFTGRELLFCAAAGVVVAAANLFAVHAVAARIR